MNLIALERLNVVVLRCSYFCESSCIRFVSFYNCMKAEMELRGQQDVYSDAGAIMDFVDEDRSRPKR